MERHKCKLCLKCFSNGRALGGHMRSHLLNLPATQKHFQAEGEDEDDDRHQPPIQLAEDTESASSSSSEEEAAAVAEGEDDGDDKEGIYYGLRENPKRSVRLVDPEFSFAVDATSSVVLQDRESETESSKNPTRRRSKRTRKSLEIYQYHLHLQQQRQVVQQQQENNNINSSNIKKLKFEKFNNKTTESTWVEPEPVSSISDTTTEEDVAFCLMMLSRDKWKRKDKQNHREQEQAYPQEEEEDEEEEEEEEEEESEKSIEETYESDEFKSCKPRSRGKYRCETCNKVFKSYQALGGHRASHKKLKLYTPLIQEAAETGKNNKNHSSNAVTSSSVAVKKIHQCPYCFRVFSSGQALGGHKRSHVLTGVATTTATNPPARIISSTTTTTKINEDNFNLIDLNLPAPVDEDDLSQVELSAVSDAEFVNHIRR